MPTPVLKQTNFCHLHVYVWSILCLYYHTTRKPICRCQRVTHWIKFVVYKNPIENTGRCITRRCQVFTFWAVIFAWYKMPENTKLLLSRCASQAPLAGALFRASPRERTTLPPNPWSSFSSSSKYGQTSTNWRPVTLKQSGVAAVICTFTQKSKWRITAVLTKIETDVSGSSRKGRDSGIGGVPRIQFMVGCDPWSAQGAVSEQCHHGRLGRSCHFTSS